MNRRSVPSAGCPMQAHSTAALRRRPPGRPSAPPASRWTQSGPCWHKNVLNPLSPVIHLWQGGFFMKRKWWTVCFLSILAGSALHFLYDLWPNPLTAVFAPVNESVWEHLKLLYWPFSRRRVRADDEGRSGRPKSWCGLLADFWARRCFFWARITHSCPASRCTACRSTLFCTRWQWPAALGWRGICRKGAPGMAVRASCDRGRDLWGGAGAVFLCAAGSAYFPPVGAKKSAVCC